MSSKEVLSINNLRFAYSKEPVFDGLSLSLQSHQLTGLLALNGQGKSTLLKLLAGVLPLSLPLVKYHMPEKNLGYMPERPLFFPELSVVDNIRYAAKINRIDKPRLEDAVNTAMQSCRLLQVQNKLSSSLSKGYQQRLGMAMAMVHNPLLLLLDEPTDGMDPEQLSDAWRVINAQKQHSSILISSHRLSEIAEHCDRVLIMHDGVICEDLLLTDEDHRQQLQARFATVTTGAVT